MKKHSILLLFSFLCFLLPAQGISSLQQKKLSNAISAITNLYVDTINDKKMVETAIESMLKELDPHSSYIPKSEVDRVNEPLEGSFEGVGIQFQLLEDTLLVVQTIAGCPAEKVGVLPGDRIIYIGDELIAGVKMQNSDITARLRGPKGTEVTVKILRRGKPELFVFKIIRDKIPIYSVDAAYMIGKETGYIKINNFGSTTVEEFQKAFTKLQKSGMKHLVLSLQGNGGGYLTAAYQLADEFLGRDKLIVYTQGLNQPKSIMEATAKGRFESGKLIVLVDEYSASASEIVSGALQDWDRAIIVGRRTFGKGLVQRQLPLVDGSMLRLTTARYYTPTGRCIQKPYKDGVDKYEKDIINRYNHGELLHADSIHFPDSLRYQTLQLKRTVYGGGGIMPDIFVPFDTTRYTNYHRQIVGRGVLSKVTAQFIDKNRIDLKKKYPSFEKFKKNYMVDDELFGQIKLDAEKEKIPFDSVQFDISKPLIRLQIKALIARDLWEMNEYYQIMDAENESLQKAVEILQTPGAYEKILK
ncbi:MAG: S41 family peptidase [Bacteroidales bacterium]|nr:S41 family peptidase [Bacteroidales bacterium]